MTYKIGQGLLARIAFADGKMPEYKRTYLVVFVDDVKIGVLNVSSLAGKEHKLLFPHNLRIRQYRPPFLKESFVKLDSLVYVNLDDISDARVLHHGERLDDGELQAILGKCIWERK